MGITIEMRRRRLALAAETFRQSHYRHDADPEDEIFAISRRYERHILGERMTLADLLTDLMGD